MRTPDPEAESESFAAPTLIYVNAKRVWRERECSTPQRRVAHGTSTRKGRRGDNETRGRTVCSLQGKAKFDLTLHSYTLSFGKCIFPASGGGPPKGGAFPRGFVLVRRRQSRLETLAGQGGQVRIVYEIYTFFSNLPPVYKTCILQKEHIHLCALYSIFPSFPSSNSPLDNRAYLATLSLHSLFVRQGRKCQKAGRAIEA